MKPRYFTLLVLFLTLSFTACDSNVVKEENRKLVEITNKKINRIDNNGRVEIIEDDFHDGDSVYKIRAYYNDVDMKYLLKIVSILRTSKMDRDDYFYFENNAPIFSGHLVNERNDHDAAEYKYYYQDDMIVESLYWEDHYEPGKRFPHESFEEFEPNMDSLMETERERLFFFLSKLNMEGFEIRHLNENLEANTFD
jgi:hypothetical protein